MAQFVSAGQRKRKLIVTAIVSALVALLVGLFAGRASVPTVSERAAEVARKGNDLATRISALTIEYEQAVDGKGTDTLAKGVSEPLATIMEETNTLLNGAPWIAPTQAKSLKSSLDSVTTAVSSRVSTEQFAVVTDAAAQQLRDRFGVR